jgi:hypothetical protein
MRSRCRPYSSFELGTPKKIEAAFFPLKATTSGERVSIARRSCSVSKQPLGRVGVHAGGVFRQIRETDAVVKQTATLVGLQLDRRQSDLVKDAPKSIAFAGIIETLLGRSSASGRSNNDEL